MQRWSDICEIRDALLSKNLWRLKFSSDWGKFTNSNYLDWLLVIDPYLTGFKTYGFKEFLSTFFFEFLYEDLKESLLINDSSLKNVGVSISTEILKEDFLGCNINGECFWIAFFFASRLNEFFAYVFFNHFWMASKFLI